MINAATPLRDVALIVGDALSRSGIVAVLTGGSAATFYAPEAYQSRDLDFVLEYSATARFSDAPLRTLGFQLATNMYVHPENPLTIDFLRAPLSVGEERIEQWDAVEENGRTLNIISPTDCVRDRLAGFLFYNDRSGLTQALSVAQACADRVDLAAVEAWCDREGENPKFQIFRALLPPPPAEPR